MRTATRAASTIALGALFALGGIAGCGSAVNTTTAPGFSPAEYEQVAVGEFTTGNAAYGKDKEVRQLVIREFETNLGRMGFEIIERNRIQQVLDEQGMQWGEVTTEEGRTEVGNVTNVDAILIGSVPTYTRTDDGKPKVTVAAELVDIETGEVLWSGTAQSSSGGPGLGDLLSAASEVADDPDIRDDISDAQETYDDLGLGSSMGETVTGLVQKLCKTLMSG